MSNDYLSRKRKRLTKENKLLKHKKEEVENREEKMREKTRESIHKKDHQISALLYLNTYII